MNSRMRKRTSLFAVGILILMTLTTYAQERCSDVLIEQFSSIESRASASVAWLNVVNEGNYTAAKAKAGAKYKSLFSGNYEQFKERRSEYFRQISYVSDSSESESEVRSYLLQIQIESWERCMRGKQSYLFVRFVDIAEDGATLLVESGAPDGAPPIRSVITTLRGAKETSEGAIELSKLKEINGSRRFDLVREARGGRIVGTITGNLYGTTYSESFSLAKYQNPPPPCNPDPVSTTVYGDAFIEENTSSVNMVFSVDLTDLFYVSAPSMSPSNGNLISRRREAGSVVMDLAKADQVRVIREGDSNVRITIKPAHLFYIDTGKSDNSTGAKVTYRRICGN